MNLSDLLPKYTYCVLRSQEIDGSRADLYVFDGCIIVHFRPTNHYDMMIHQTFDQSRNNHFPSNDDWEKTIKLLETLNCKEFSKWLKGTMIRPK